MEVCIVVFAFFVASFGFSSAASFNVMSYGAVGDGKRDDSAAFLKAWKAVCQAPQNTPPTLLIPGKRAFLLKPVTFKGPCKSSRIYVKVIGNIIAPNQRAAWSGYPSNFWLVFSNVNGLIINGGGQIDGQGSAWWPCAKAGSCRGPTALTFKRCNNLRLNGLKHVNSQRNHMTITACNRVIISKLLIVASEDSPNTDGIDIASSNNVRILNSYIGTGDDCIAISGGSSNIDISNINCGPGHGISIGALGHGGFDTVENVNVQNCTLRKTLTGVRIKTWQGGSGYARKISFTNIKFVAVNNAIIIDQFYCPSQVNCQNKTSAVKVSDVTFSRIVGTSAMDKVINLSCSQSVGCSNIVFDRVNIASTDPKRKAYSFCKNVRGSAMNTVPFIPCLSSKGLQTTI